MKISESLVKDLQKKLVLIAYTLMFAHAGIGKLVAGKTPDWFLRQFEASILNVFSGSLSIQFFGIGLAESLIAVLALLGLFQKSLQDQILKVVLLSSSGLFIVLSFGQRISYKFDDAASLFFYAIASIALLSLFKESNESA